MSTVAHCSEEVAQAVAYEIMMFGFLKKRVEDSKFEMCGKMVPGQILYLGTGGPHEEEASSFLESFLLHTRVLYDFFCKPRGPRNPDDVVASDFVPSWETGRSVKQCRYLSAEKDRLNKSLAHLSTLRVKYEIDGKGWEITTIDSEITRLISQFKNEICTEYAPWFDYKSYT